MTVASTPSQRQHGAVSPRLLGIILTLIGVLANRWVLGALFAPDGNIDGEWRNVQIAAVELLFVLAGVVLLATPIYDWIRAGRWRIVTTAALVPALALLIAVSGFGVYLYLNKHEHTIEHQHAGAPTPEQQKWADDMVDKAWEVALRNGWFDFEKAQRDGFHLQWSDREHYVNRDNMFDDEILNIEKPEYLMYIDSPRGKLLVGYMFYTRSLEEKGPTPFGPLGAWHYHPWPGRGLCAIEGLLPVSRPDEQGNCAEGEHVTRSAEMFHVWLIEHPLGRFSDSMVFPEFESSMDISWIHPILVHFTIALFLIAIALDIIGLLAGSALLHRVAFVNLICASVFTLATVGAGMAAEMHVTISHADHELVHHHKSIGFSILALMLVMTIWRALLRGRFPARAAAAVYLVLALGGAGLTMAGGYLGGELVYKRGVAVHATDNFVLQSYLHKIDRALGRADVATSDHSHHH